MAGRTCRLAGVIHRRRRPGSVAIAVPMTSRTSHRNRDVVARFGFLRPLWGIAAVMAIGTSLTGQRMIHLGALEAGVSRSVAVLT